MLPTLTTTNSIEVQWFNPFHARRWANKWVIFGTAGGGANYHFDYYLSSFWNMVITGSKYWVITEPYDTLAIFNNSDDKLKEVMNLSINDFFKNYYLNGFMDKEFERINKEKNDGKTHKYYECIQNPGDILYAPPIYYHSTVNLEETLSVSRNMITKRNYQQSFNFITCCIHN